MYRLDSGTGNTASEEDVRCVLVREGFLCWCSRSNLQLNMVERSTDEGARKLYDCAALLRPKLVVKLES